MQTIWNVKAYFYGKNNKFSKILSVGFFLSKAQLFKANDIVS